MDPLSALSLAAAVAQFIEFGFKILTTTRAICDSSTGTSEEDKDLEDKALEIQRQVQKYAQHQSQNLSDDELALLRLA